MLAVRPLIRLVKRADVLSVQTSTEKLAALGLYRTLDFQQVDTATLYRLPASLSDRSRPA